MTDSADTQARREDRIPVDPNQPLVLGVHNPGGDITVRAAERTDVLISHLAPGFSGELGDEEIEFIIDADQNRIDVRGNPHAGTGWAGIAGEVDLDAVVGQITRAFRRAGPWASGHHWSEPSTATPISATGGSSSRRTGGNTSSGRATWSGVCGCCQPASGPYRSTSP